MLIVGLLDSTYDYIISTVFVQYVIIKTLPMHKYAVMYNCTTYKWRSIPCTTLCTVEPVLKDHPIGHKNVVCKDVVSDVSDDRLSYIEMTRSFCQKRMVCQDRWSHGSGLSRQVSLYNDVHTCSMCSTAWSYIVYLCDFRLAIYKYK